MSQPRNLSLTQQPIYKGYKMKNVMPFFFWLALSAGALAQTDAQKQAAMAEVAKTHPDWAQIVRSQGFDQWLAKQPPSLIKVANDSWEPSQIIMLIDLYKRDSTQPVVSRTAPQTTTMSDDEKALQLLSVILSGAAAFQVGQSLNRPPVIIDNSPSLDKKPRHAAPPSYTCQPNVAGSQYNCTPGLY